MAASPQSILSILTLLLPDIPQVIAFVEAVEAAVKAEAAATTYAGKVKALEPALEAAAALADLIKGQV